ncbi:tetratricopeptide repeat protein [Proteiniphilum sp.]|uniref:tetratricopeptide repeat protein n=1 Tax=Proteiniphilum sp. TaxID=1926877 RepID=UPI003323D76B
MKNVFYILLMAIGLSFFWECNPNPQPEASRLLADAGRLIESNPDSAMQLIDSLFYPEESFLHKDYMRYLVLRVQARYKTHRPVAEDTLVFQARDYFSGREEPRQAALAWFYSGCVYRERKEYENAVQQYKEAGKHARQTGDADLQGLIQYNLGDLLAKQGFHLEALENYKKAERFYAQSPDKPHEKQANCLSAIGRMYALLNQPDSALLSFHTGLDLAGNRGDLPLQSLLAQNLGVMYKEAKQFDKAETYLRQSFRFNADSAKLPRYYLNFAELYTGMGRPDSAAWYTKQLKEHINAVEDDYFKASAYSYLAGREKEQANYEAAFAYQDERMNTLHRIMEERANQSVYEAHLKYDYEQMQKQYYRDLSVRRLWIIALQAMVIVGGVLFWWYWARQKNRQAEIRHNIETLKEMKRDLESTVYQKQLDLRRDILLGFDVARKVMELNREMTRPGKSGSGGALWGERFNKIVYGEESIEETWDALFRIFNAMRPGLAGKVREKYPDLTETEFRVCILTYAGFRVKEISLILHQSVHTVQTRRTDIRRKMGLEPGGDIAGHIDRLPD